MRRADRLFEIIQFMRQRQLTRARDLAEKLEVSERTIYRDIADLMASGVPIEGEAGIGYVLRAGYDLPPLMFKEAEIEALVLGARIVQSWADKELAEAAGDVIAKVEAVVPEALRKYMTNTALLAPSMHYMEPISFDLAELRNALRDQHKVSIDYRDAMATRHRGRCGRCRWPISARSGLWRAGANCARTSAPSGWTAYRGSA
jgi:predicted DNA-binding transcriptional regulator YafY